MQDGSTHETCATVQEPNNQCRNKVAGQFVPVANTSTNVDHCENIVRLAEELVASKTDSPGSTEGKEEEQKDHRHASPDHVELLNPITSNSGLGLIKLRFNNGPAYCVQSRLYYDDIAEPSMKEVEALVR